MNGAGLLRVVDLFSGCGQMSVGAREAARALGRRTQLSLAFDLSADATRVCESTFVGSTAVTGRIEESINGELGRRPTSSEKRLVDRVGEVDLLLGGPPCQGHSDLNNYTRRNDLRNRLGLRVLRFAELVRPKFVLLENVKGIVHDKAGVFEAIEEGLRDLGYRTGSALIRAEQHGVPQTRHRMLLVGSLTEVAPRWTLEIPTRAIRPFSWACGELGELEPQSEFDRPSQPSKENLRRLRYLFAYEKWDLPNNLRPPCHRDGNHSYKSAYGRMYWDRPSQTITTGFRSMGQGRFVHPRHPRTITAHEAARLQFIPDFVDFSGLRPTSVARLVGNAVPTKLVFDVVLRMLVGVEAARRDVAPV